MALVGISATTTAANASPAPQKYYGTAATPEQVAAAQTAIAQIDQYKAAFSQSGTTVHFDATAALNMGASHTLVQQIADGIAEGGGTVSGVSIDSAAVASAAKVVSLAKSSCRGVNNYSTQWFGEQLKVNSCDVGRIIGDLAAGSSIAALAALISSETGIGGLGAGVLAAILGLGSGVLASCAADGKGVIIDVAWNGVPWCSSQ